MPTMLFISPTSHRWIVCVLCALACVILKVDYFCFTELVDLADSAMTIHSIPSGGCPFLFSGTVWESQKLPIKLPDFYWDVNNTKIASDAQYITYLLTCVPAGVLSDVGYSRYVLGGGMFLVAVCNLILSTFHSMGDTLFMTVNVMKGLNWAMIYPSAFSLASHWSLPTQRNIYTSTLMLGPFCGSAVGTLLLHFVHFSLKSWKTSHTIVCISAVLWLVFCFIFIHNSPNESPLIRKLEDHNTSCRKTLLKSLKRLKDIPWCKIATSLPFLSLFLAWYSVNNVSRVKINAIKDYQKYILHLPENASDQAALVIDWYIAPLAVMGGLMADWVIQNHLMSNTAVKKTFSLFSVLLSSLLQVLFPLVGCNIVLLWILSISAVFVLGLAVPVIYSTPIHLSPRHSGLLVGILLSMGVLCTKFNNKLYSLLITDSYNRVQWRNLFALYSILSVAMMIPFIFFGSGEVQSWDSSQRRRLQTTTR